MFYGGRSTALKPRAIKAVGVKGAALRALVPLPRSKGTAGRGPSGGVTPLLHEELLSAVTQRRLPGAIITPHPPLWGTFSQGEGFRAAAKVEQNPAAAVYQ